MIKVKLFKNGRNQAIRIPKEFEFKGVNEVYIRKDGNRIIIELVRKSWLSYAELPKADAEFMTERPELLSGIEAVLVTNNQKHFSKVPKLKLNNWVNLTD